MKFNDPIVIFCIFLTPFSTLFKCIHGGNVINNLNKIIHLEYDSDENGNESANNGNAINANGNNIDRSNANGNIRANNAHESIENGNVRADGNANGNRNNKNGNNGIGLSVPSSSSSYTGWEYETAEDKEARRKYYRKLLDENRILEMPKMPSIANLCNSPKMPKLCNSPKMPKLCNSPKMPSMPKLCNAMANKLLRTKSNANFNDEENENVSSTVVEVSEESSETESDSAEKDLTLENLMKNEHKTKDGLSADKAKLNENLSDKNEKLSDENGGIKGGSIYGDLPSGSLSHAWLMHKASQIEQKRMKRKLSKKEQNFSFKIENIIEQSKNYELNDGKRK